MFKRLIAGLLPTTSLLVAADSSTNATLTGASDGIWTGHNWNDTTMEIGVNNGLPFGLEEG